MVAKWIPRTPERIASVLSCLGYTKPKEWKEADFLAFNACSETPKVEDKVFGLRHKLTELKKITTFAVAISGLYGAWYFTKK